jgi:hypothetical protein
MCIIHEGVLHRTLSPSWGKQISLFDRATRAVPIMSSTALVDPDSSAACGIDSLSDQVKSFEPRRSDLGEARLAARRERYVSYADERLSAWIES